MNLKISFLIVGTVAVLIGACSTTKNTASATINNPVDAEVTVSIQYTSNYCGGAPPPDELIKRLRTPKKYADQEIHLSKEDKLNDDMKKYNTNANGELTTNLDAGTYYLFMPEKISSELTKGGDSEQCKKWKNTPNGKFTIVAGTSEVAVSITKTCERCGALRM